VTYIVMLRKISLKSDNWLLSYRQRMTFNVVTIRHLEF